MPLLPRWQYMTEESKALTRRVAISTGVVVLALLLVRALLPWVLLIVVVAWLWGWLSRRGCSPRGAIP